MTSLALENSSDLPTGNCQGELKNRKKRAREKPVLIVFWRSPNVRSKAGELFLFSSTLLDFRAGRPPDKSLHVSIAL